MSLKIRFPNIELNEYVVMPNHFHGILEIVGATLVVAPIDDTAPIDDIMKKGQQGIAPTDKTIDGIMEKGQQGIAPTNKTIDGIMEKGQPQGIAPTNKTIGNMMDAFKSITTVEYIRGVKNLGWKPFNGKLWQRNYYEHIIRNQQSYENISNYIQNNPAKWQEDKLYGK
jgi:REP element-mobilizing transposase RayT